MALKLKIGQSAYDGLPADVKKEYKQEGSDWVLDLDGYEDPAELRRARDREKEEGATAKRDAAKYKTDLENATRKIADLEKDGKTVDERVNAKNTEWQTKYDKDIAERDTKFTGFRNTVTDNHRKSLATNLATKLSGSPSLLIGPIADRIEVEFDEATNTIKHYVKDAAGKRTAGTLDDLEKEVLKNKEYAPILRATKASGGGGAPPTPGGGGAPRHTPQRGTPSPDDLTRMDPADLAARITAQREARGA